MAHPSERTPSVKGIILLFVFFNSFSTAYPSKVDSLYNLINSTSDPVEKMDLYIKIGDQYEFSEPQKAIYYYTRAYDISSSIRAESGHRALMPHAEYLRAKSLRFRGIVYSDAGNFNEALENFFEAKKVLEELMTLYTSHAREEVDLKMAKLLNNIGIVYSKQSLFNIAKEYYQQALEVYVRLDDQKSIAVVKSSMGIVEARQANIPEALDYFSKALEIYTQINDKEGVAQTYNNIGNMHMHHNNYQEALDLYRRAYQIFGEMNFINRMGAVANNIARALQHMGNEEEALKYFYTSIDLRKKVNDKRGLTETYNNIGGLYLGRNEYELASQFFQNALDVSRDLGDNYHLAIAYINMGSVAAAEGNYDDAIAQTKTGKELATKHNLRFLVATAMYQLAGHFAGKGDYARAYDFSRQHYELSQSILDEEKSRQISELEFAYQAREKQQKIELLEQETKINQLNLRQSSTWIFVLVLIFIVLLLSGIFSIIFFKQRSKILLKNKEIETNYLIRKTRNDLQAVINNNPHVLLLFDNKLNVVSLNSRAQSWFEMFFGFAIGNNDSLYSIPDSRINTIINDLLFYSLRGDVRERNIEFTSIKDNKSHLYKIHSSPVFGDSDKIIQSVNLIIEELPVK